MRALVAQMEQLRAEQRRAAVLDERTRIAREIHDVLAHPRHHHSLVGAYCAG